MAELYATDLPVSPAPGRGYGHYATYHALWHLREIGVVPDLTTFDSPAWDAAEAGIAASGRPTRIALIDVSVAYDHPNLRSAILTDLMVDFFSARFGAFPRPDPDGRRLSAALSRKDEAADLLAGTRVWTLFETLCQHLDDNHRSKGPEDWRTPLRIAPATSPAFSAHGTAMAGLIGARPLGPEAVGLAVTQHIGLADGQPRPETPKAIGLPYAGVDPFCEIVPISTSFDPDPEQLVLALLYALLIDADVIVLARDFPDPVRTSLVRSLMSDPDIPTEGETAAIVAAYPVEIATDTDLWDDLMQLTLDISKRIPIVCAAGNAGDELLMYPGRLARDDNGIIAVGALAASGLRAGYSSASGRDSPSKVTIYAPSGDGERLDRGLQRVDTAAPGFRPEDHSEQYLARLRVQHPAIVNGKPVTEASVFATQEIISTDVPGAAGYNSSAFSRPSTSIGGVLDYRSYYCHFSGTSAATAIVAGALSLGIASGKIPRGDPKTAKMRLRPPQAQGAGAAEPFVSWRHIEFHQA